MKRLALAVAVIAGAALIAVAALAWDLPTSAKGVGDAAGKMALQTALNKKLEANNCTFKGNTAATTCDLKKVSNELAAIYKGAKEATKYNVNIKIVADDSAAKKNPVSATDRGYKVKEALNSTLTSAVAGNTWNYDVTASGNKGDRLALKAEVK